MLEAEIAQRSRAQLMLMEYELLDAYWVHLHQRIWLSALVVVGLTMIGVTFLASSAIPSDIRGQLMTFVAVVAGLFTLGWWLLIRQMLLNQRVTEFRKKEMEREMGLRMQLYLGYAKNIRAYGRKNRANWISNEAAGALDVETDLNNLAASPEANQWLGSLVREEFIWNALPVLLIVTWVGLLIIG